MRKICYVFCTLMVLYAHLVLRFCLGYIEFNLKVHYGYYIYW